MIVFQVFGSFLKNCVKYLKCVDCWLSFKNKNKTIWVVLQRLTLCRDGTKLSSILFIPLHGFGAGTWDVLVYPMRFHIYSSQYEREAPWYQVAEYNWMILCLGLGSFQMMISSSFIVAWNKEVVWYMLTSQVAFWPEI